MSTAVFSSQVWSSQSSPGIGGLSCTRVISSFSSSAVEAKGSLGSLVRDSACKLAIDMDSVALRVRDRHLVRLAVAQQYPTKGKLAAESQAELVTAVVDAIWLPAHIDTKVAFSGISSAVKKVWSLVRRSPQLWEKLRSVLGIEGWDEMSLAQKAKALSSRLKDVLHDARNVLGRAFKAMANSFPLSLFFVPKSKMPGLTDLLNRIAQRSPKLRKILAGIHGGAIKVDNLFEKYIPKLRKPLYAAIFIWVWLNVAEISWDIQGILAGVTGQISLSELLASLPESGIGFIAASFGLGYGALPYALITRLMWLVAQKYLSYAPGKGFVVHWEKMGFRQRNELVPA